MKRPPKVFFCFSQAITILFPLQSFGRNNCMFLGKCRWAVKYKGIYGAGEH
jgi:hypothetical protein